MVDFDEWNEIIALFDGVVEHPDRLELVLLFTKPERTISMSFPLQSREYAILVNALSDVKIGEMIGILHTDDSINPILVRKIGHNGGE